MSNAMHVAKTGLNAQNSRMQVIANNLANVNTTGFKRDRANFETLLYQVIKASGAQTSGETRTNSAFSVGTGVRIINADKLFSQGNIVSTDNSLDLSIDGSGFFQVLMPDGRIGFTRNGAFGRNAEGLLTTASGYVFVAVPDCGCDVIDRLSGGRRIFTRDGFERRSSSPTSSTAGGILGLQYRFSEPH